MSIESKQNSSPKLHWTHVELGGANYGMAKGHVSKHEGRKADPFQPLYHTVDDLIAKLGPKGTFFINDLKPGDCELACKRLDAYLIQRYPRDQYPKVSIKIEAVAKDYHLIDFPTDCGVDQVDSLHLKNPDTHQLDSDLLNRDSWMTTMVAHSKSGLTIFTPYSHQMRNQQVFSAAGEKSEKPLRCAVSDASVDKFVYVDPDGTYRHSWEGSTHAYSIRTPVRSEKYSPAESSARQERKQEIREIVQKSVAEANAKLAALKDDPDYPLILAFARTRMSSLETEAPNMSKLDLMEDLDDPKILEELLEDLSLYTQRVVSSFETEKANLDVGVGQASSQSSETGLVLKRSRSSVTPTQIWARLGLADAYKEHFANDEVFWESPKTLREIFHELKGS